MLLNNRKELRERRKELRNHSTSAEAALWHMLKHKQLAGYKFRRQHSIGKFILDFYCPSEKLAVELDGHTHKFPEQAAYDAERSNFLQSKGIRIIRIDNRRVFDNTYPVLDFILESLRQNK